MPLGPQSQQRTQRPASLAQATHAAPSARSGRARGQGGCPLPDPSGTRGRRSPCRACCWSSSRAFRANKLDTNRGEEPQANGPGQPRPQRNWTPQLRAFEAPPLPPGRWQDRESENAMPARTPAQELAALMAAPFQQALRQRLAECRELQQGARQVAHRPKSRRRQRPLDPPEARKGRRRQRTRPDLSPSPDGDRATARPCGADASPGPTPTGEPSPPPEAETRPRLACLARVAERPGSAGRARTARRRTAGPRRGLPKKRSAAKTLRGRQDESQAGWPDCERVSHARTRRTLQSTSITVRARSA